MASQQAELPAIRWTLQRTVQTETEGVPVTETGIDIFRVADGKLAELWQHFDELGQNQQLEAIPTTSAAGKPTA